jgi:hypothetical protein
MVDVLCIFAEKGYRWENPGRSELRIFREGLARAQRYEALETFKRLTNAGFISGGGLPATR